MFECWESLRLQSIPCRDPRAKIITWKPETKENYAGLQEASQSIRKEFWKNKNNKTTNKPNRFQVYISQLQNKNRICNRSKPLLDSNQRSRIAI